MKSSLFPAMNTTQEAKLKHLLDMISEYMSTTITIESVISMQVHYPDDRTDVEAIIKKLANKKPNIKQNNKLEPDDPK